MPKRIQTKHHVEYGKFFRSRLLISDPDQVTKMLDQMDKEASEIRQEALKMSWYMRGGITYEQVLNLGITERDFIGKLIKENLDTTKKSGLPFF